MDQGLNPAVSSLFVGGSFFLTFFLGLCLILFCFKMPGPKNYSTLVINVLNFSFTRHYFHLLENGLVKVLECTDDKLCFVTVGG